MSKTPAPQGQWSETDSNLFLNVAEIFVPARAEQVSTLLQLVPAQANETFTAVELGAGDGTLAEAVLENFSHCHYMALDGSETMRTRLQQRLARFGERLEIRPFELGATDWRTQLPEQVRCVLSSLRQLCAPVRCPQLERPNLQAHTIAGASALCALIALRTPPGHQRTCSGN